MRWTALAACAVLFGVGCGDDIGSPVPFPDGGVIDASQPDECLPPMTVCGSQCVNLQTSARNCGSCGNGCSASTYCDMGTCSTSCSSGQALCGDSCVDFASDRQHCGGCGNVCREDQVCAGGSCVCARGQRDCDGECADLDESNTHCGACGNACEGDEGCDEGTCRKLRETDCDNGVDEDADGDRDCADRDCLGFTRSCDCEVAGMTGEEACQMDGSFGDCQGCPAPECGPSMPCENYGYRCDGATCSFDTTSTFDLELLQVSIESTNRDCSADGITNWDTGSGADVYVLVDTMGAMGRAPLSGSVLANPENSYTVSFGADSTILRGVRADQLQDTFRVTVYEEDDFNADDLVNICRIVPLERYFSGDAIRVTCEATTGMCDADPRVLPRAEYRLEFRLVEPR